MSVLKKIYSKKKLSDGRIKLRLLGISLKYRPLNAPYPPVKQPKLGISYSVWDGEELLEGSIHAIKPAVDYVNVVWQRLSWHGKECNPNLENQLLSLKEKGLIDEIIFFDCDPKIHPNVNECTKRNLGLTAAQRAGCTHFIPLDVDEYYELEQFKKAYQYILEQNISHSACVQFAYRTATVRDTNPLNFFAPFIYRIDHGEKLELDAFGGFLPWLLDPTKQIAIKKRSRISFLHQIYLHHFSFTRNDLEKKLQNSSANKSENWVQEYKKSVGLIDDDIEKKLKQGIYVKVPNIFNVNID